jgi:hypothetical protein
MFLPKQVAPILRASVGTVATQQTEGIVAQGEILTAYDYLSICENDKLTIKKVNKNNHNEVFGVVNSNHGCSGSVEKVMEKRNKQGVDNEPFDIRG